MSDGVGVLFERLKEKCAPAPSGYLMAQLDGVREHGEHYPVSIVVEPQSGRLCVRAVNEGGNNDTLVDLEDLVKCLHLGPE